MTIKQLHTDDSAVSPVIGVILMVAITVILAAVIGTFVLGLGDQVSDNSPQASFNFDFKNDSAVTITHEGGDKLDRSSLTVTVASTDAYNDSQANPDGNWQTFGASWDSDVIAGSSQTLYDSDDTSYSGETVRIVWSSSSSGDTATIAKADWP